MKHEIMWWMSRITIMLTSLFLSFTLASSAYAAEIQMGSGGNLVFNPSELTVNSHGSKTNIPSLPIVISAAYACPPSKKQDNPINIQANNLFIQTLRFFFCNVVIVQN